MTVVPHVPSGKCASTSNNTFVRDLLRCGKRCGNNVDMNARDGEGLTPLHMAMQGPDTLAPAMLLNTREAHLNVKDEAGLTPAQHAAEAGRMTNLELISGSNLMDPLDEEYSLLMEIATVKQRTNVEGLAGVMSLWPGM